MTKYTTAYSWTEHVWLILAIVIVIVIVIVNILLSTPLMIRAFQG